MFSSSNYSSLKTGVIKNNYINVKMRSLFFKVGSPWNKKNMMWRKCGIYNDFDNIKDVYVCVSFIQVFSNEKLNCRNWIGWSLGDVFVHLLTLVAAFRTSKHLPPWGIFHCEVFSEATFWAARSFPPKDTLGLGCNFFHHQTFSASIPWLLIDYQLTKYEKGKKRVSYHLFR